MYYVDEVDMSGAFALIGSQVSRNAGYVVEEKREEVNLALQLVQRIQEKAEKEGMLALEEMLDDIKGSRAPYADFLPDKIMMMVNGVYANLVTEVMVNQFYVRTSSDFEAVVLYIYMLGLEMIQKKGFKEINDYLLALPQECREVFMRKSNSCSFKSS